MSKTYPSKVDGWLKPLLLLAFLSGPACMLPGLYSLVVSGVSNPGAWIAIGSGAFVTALMVLLAWPVEYTLTEDTLIVRFGQIRSKIPYANIKAVYPTNNILSSPALSLDRLQIEDGKWGVMISPENKEAFLEDLASRIDGLELKDGKLQPSSTDD